MSAGTAQTLIDFPRRIHVLIICCSLNMRRKINWEWSYSLQFRTQKDLVFIENVLIIKSYYGELFYVEVMLGVKWDYHCSTIVFPSWHFIPSLLSSNDMIEFHEYLPYSKSCYAIVIRSWNLNLNDFSKTFAFWQYVIFDLDNFILLI